jgi:hypothetical protein
MKAERLIKLGELFASTTKGGPSSVTGIQKNSPLEILLEIARDNPFPRTADYQIKDIELVKCKVIGKKPFNAPVIFLYDREKQRDVVCLRTKNQFGHINYGLYTYTEDGD